MVIKKQKIRIPTVTLRRSSRTLDVNDKPENILLGLRSVSETLGVKQFKHLYDDSNEDHQVPKWRIFCLLSMGLISIAWGIASLIYTPLQMLLSIRLEMSSGLPPYEWWKVPPDEVLLRAYVFNITNSESFLNGTDKKLIVQEVGPIIYREKLRHDNVRHNENSTLTYTANRTAIFLPEMNSVDLNDTIYVPNVAVLLIPAIFHDSSMFVRLGANMLLRSYNSQPIVKTTIQNFLWNMSDPILSPAKKIAPFLVPTMNVGILNIVYSNFEDNLTVFIGNKHGNSKFFTVDTYDGLEYLPNFSDPKKCQQSFRNASEGLSYPQMVTKDANLTYWRKTVCKLSDIRYSKDQQKYGMNAYRFNLVSWAYDRVEWEGNKDCYAGSPPLPNGMIDVSRCYWGFPLSVSFPHFLYGDDIIRSYVNGLTPNEEDHGSYVLIEPNTGIPLEGKAKSQINLILKPYRGFSKNIQRFSDQVVPLAWLEYHQVGVPWYIEWLVYIAAVIVPTAQLPFSILCLTVGPISTYMIYRYLTRRKNDTLLKNQLIGFESEAFLKDSS